MGVFGIVRSIYASRNRELASGPMVRRLRLHQPEVVADLPASGRRLVQRVDGYRATLVAGTPILENGEDTGARPGRLVRARRS
jgi:N-acyl-D-aspartate/D-glutamate deacylase